MSDPASSKAPIFRYSRGRIQAAVFEQEKDGRSWLSVQIETRYQDQAGAWKSSSNYKVSELANLAHVVEVTDRWIIQRELKD
jgi:hypothetical protein